MFVHDVYVDVVLHGLQDTTRKWPQSYMVSTVYTHFDFTIPKRSNKNMQGARGIYRDNRLFGVIKILLRAKIRAIFRANFQNAAVNSTSTHACPDRNQPTEYAITAAHAQEN